MKRSAPTSDIIGTAVPRSGGLDDLPLWAGTEQDAARAEAAREAAIQQAHDHANEAWKQVAYAALVAVARRKAVFTADCVWLALHDAKPVTHEPSALGPLFRIAARKGLIQKTGRLVPTTQSQRHRDLTEWRSLIVDAAP